MSQQGDTGAKPPTQGETKPPIGSRAQSEAEPDASASSEGVVWLQVSPSQVMRTVAVALLTAAVVLGAFFVLWQLRTFVAWFFAALFLSAVLNPAVNWFQRRHRMIKRPLAIALVYLGVVVALLFMVGILLPVLIDQIQGLINFAATAAKAPGGPTKYLEDLARQNGLGSVLNRFGDQIDNLRGQLKGAASNVLLSTGGIVVGLAEFVAALVTVLTLTFFLILGSERYLNACVGLFAEPHRPLVRSLLTQSGGAVTGYVTGNLAISVICGVTTFIVLEVLGMPYAAALALLVAVLDLIPLVGATLGGALLVVVGFFVEPWIAVVLLVYIVIYQQVEGSLLQPLVYSRAVHLNALAIFGAILAGGLLLGIPGALLAVPVAEIIRIVVTDILAYRRTGSDEAVPAVPPSQPAQ